MKNIKTLSLLSLATLSTLGALPAWAQDSYYYLGVGAGKSRTNLDSQRIATEQAGPGLTVTNLARDNNDTAYKVFLGYQFNPYLGLEVGYFNLGKFSFQSTTAPPGSLNGRFQVQGGNFDVVGTWPLAHDFALLGRVGAQVARTRATFDESGAVALTSLSYGHRELDAKVGVGLQYAFTPGVLMRAEAERFRINDAVGNKPTVNMYSVSLVFPFGRGAGSSHMAMAMATPTYASEPPPPMPRAAPAVVAEAAPMAPPPVLRSVTYDAESMFSFDKTELHPKGKQALDQLVQDLQGLSYGQISVAGYADRLGSDDYNRKLSLARAEAVKAYLVSNGKIDAGRISTSGMGESNPVTPPGECVGKAETAKLIKCLRPDRRVEITVTGTK
jgi:OOP family OmpA-OmpF porin